jgi:putative ABC transport system permease protein
MLFILNLSLGLVGFIALDTFKVSLQQVLDQNAKTFLSADLSLSARRTISPLELTETERILGGQFERSHLWEFFSMVNTRGGAKLVQVKGIEGNYPFYGEMKLGSGRRITGASEKEISEQMKVWVYPELLTSLNLKVGDKLKLGESEYEISDTVVDDSTQTFRLSSLAPKIYGGIAMIEKSGLVKKGTTFTDAYLYRLPLGADTEGLAKEIFKKVTDPGVQVTTAQEAGRESIRVLGYLNDYLGLVSLIALFLSGIGAAYLYRSFFFSQLKSMAIFNALGMVSSKARLILILQILAMSLMASVVSAGVALVFFPFLQRLLQGLSSLQVPLHLSPRILLLAAVMSSFGSLSVSLPFLLQIGRLKTGQLFQEESSISLPWRIQDFLVLIIPLGLFWGLSVWQAHSLKVGSLFFSLLVASLFVILFLNFVIFRGVSKIFSRAGWKLKYVGLQLSRKSGRTLSCALALSLGALLINLLPQLKTSIKGDIEAPDRGALPALFVFDIQEDQVQGVIQFLKDNGIQNPEPSPLVRARILKVNDQPFEKVTEEGRLQTREEEVESRFRNRGFNLSFRDQLSSSETLVEGQIWTGEYKGQAGEIPQISVEESFAKRLNFKMGDRLTFDVQGVEVFGQITSLRAVKWNRFQPNFFVVFQPGIIDDAPKAFLTAIPKSARHNSMQMQNELVSRFPNLSIVDVGRTVEKVLETSEKMSWSLELMAGLCLSVGFLVLYSIVSHQVVQSRWDLNLLKILGAGSKDTLSSLALEFGFIGFVSSSIGALLSLGFSATLARQVFDSRLVIEVAPLAFSILFITALSAILAWFSAQRVALSKPQLILQS